MKQADPTDKLPEARNPKDSPSVRYSKTRVANGPTFSPGEKLWIGAALGMVILVLVLTI